MTLSERQHVNDQTDGDGNIQVVDKSAKSQDFFQVNNSLGKKYTTARIKSRNFLSNIANGNFIFDVYLLVTKNFFE